MLSIDFSLMLSTAKPKGMFTPFREWLNAARREPKNRFSTISEASKFYDAEDYHQNYYNQNQSQGYCSYVITPKVEKVRKIFKDKLKK